MKRSRPVGTGAAATGSTARDAFCSTFRWDPTGSSSAAVSALAVIPLISELDVSMLKATMCIGFARDIVPFSTNTSNSTIPAHFHWRDKSLRRRRPINFLFPCPFYLIELFICPIGRVSSRRIFQLDLRSRSAADRQIPLFFINTRACPVPYWWAPPIVYQ